MREKDGIYMILSIIESVNHPNLGGIIFNFIIPVMASVLESPFHEGDVKSALW